MSTVITWSAELFEWKPYNAENETTSPANTREELEKLAEENSNSPVNANTREELEEIHANASEDTGIIEGAKDFMGFIGDVKEDGLVYAIWGKPFPELMGDAITGTLKWIGTFITGNADLFFLIPALGFVGMTFAFGKNRFTKWIMPLLFAYVLSRGLYGVLITK